MRSTQIKKEKELSAEINKDLKKERKQNQNKFILK